MKYARNSPTGHINCVPNPIDFLWQRTVNSTSGGKGKDVGL